MRQYIYFGVGSLAYFLWFYFGVGLRPEHIGLYVALVGLYGAHPETRRFVLAFGAFIVYWMIYDSMRVLPNYEVNPVHIAEPYALEKALFGVAGPQQARITLNEYFAQNTHAVLDVLSAFFYLSWVPVPLAFAFWLFQKDKPLFIRFSYGFLFTNILGFAIYYLYPAAPPWYIEQHGFVVRHGTPGHAAGLLNFDAIFGIRLFASMYQKNANVFAAIPSLHSAYPVLCLLYGRRLGKWWLDAVFAVFVVGIWFAAVYTRHHYVIDVLAGAATAVGGYFLFEYLAAKTRLQGWLNALLQRI
ncbi:MAG: inositol phosphorylceramide synthase [Saprospirales bacterium]|nr:inositol phosphorylceramide synthase [Saprospirales bacterium]MBK8924174.1 inositol phosphorylceramide synthase [Saprospirales bacterium]